MKPRQVILELQPNRLDVVKYDGGRCVYSRRIVVDLDTDPDKWIEGVGELSERLAKVVEEMSVQGQTAVVLYSSPTQVVELTSIEAKTTSDACDAAELRCLDSLPFSSLQAICDSCYVGRDGQRDNRKLHALAAADREDILTAIVDLVEGSGLRLDYATPISSAIFRMMAAQAMKGEGDCRGHLYIGERQSYFLISRDRRILFSRLINIGIDALARSLTRPIRMADKEGVVELDLESARTILHACGIPDEAIVVDETRNLTSRQIMPLLQPLLQRLLVELRQSMRFGLTEEQREDLKLHLSGPGCALHGIAEYLEDSLNITATRDVSYAGYDFRKPGSGGSEFLDAVRDLQKNPPIQLQPESHAKACRIGRLRQWLWAGAAAAILMIGLDGIGYQLRIDGLQRQLDAVEGLSGQFAQLQENGQKMRASLIALRDLENCVRRETGAGGDYRAAMQEIALLVPSDVRFTKLSFTMLGADTRLALSGHVFKPSEPSGDPQLELFMERLHESPLFSDERLISVQSGSHDNRPGQRFEIGCLMIHTPLPEQPDKLAIITGGLTP